jgi:hypothetical protein
MYVRGVSANKGEIIIKIWSPGAILRRAEVGNNLSWRLAWMSISHTFECVNAQRQNVCCQFHVEQAWISTGPVTAEWGVLLKAQGAVFRGCTKPGPSPVFPKVGCEFPKLRTSPIISEGCEFQKLRTFSFIWHQILKKNEVLGSSYWSNVLLRHNGKLLHALGKQNGPFAFIALKRPRPTWWSLGEDFWDMILWWSLSRKVQNRLLLVEVCMVLCEGLAKNHRPMPIGWSGNITAIPKTCVGPT